MQKLSDDDDTHAVKKLFVGKGALGEWPAWWFFNVVAKELITGWCKSCGWTSTRFVDRLFRLSVRSLITCWDWLDHSTEFSRHRNLSTCTICAAAWPLALRSCGMLRRKRRKMPHVAAPRRIGCERSFQHITTTTGPTVMSLYCVRHKGHHRLHHPRHQDVF